MKKLIIVCEEGLSHYGDFLAQLISSSDDAEGNIAGIRDVVAVATVWTEKEYVSNAAQISSEQHILFIGNSELIKRKRSHMLTKYSEYGMNYGWLGKQGTLFVDHIVTSSEYEEFYKITSKLASEISQSEVPKLIESKDETDETEVDEFVVDAEPTKKNVLLNSLSPLGRFAMDFCKELDNIANNIAVASKSSEIENQEYTCLVLKFYLNDLRNFLGLGE